MNKKLLTAAIGAALVAGPMLVAQADVKLYGRAHMSLDNLDRDVAADTGDMFVSDNSSRFGIRLSEDLGGGLKGVGQFELLLGGTGTGTGGLDRATGVQTSNRDNFVGLEGGFGSLLLGQIDSATKDIGGIADLFYREQLGESRGIINVDGGLDRRIQSGVHYRSPKLGGLSFKVQYGVEDSFTTDATQMAANVIWTGGPLTLGAGLLKVESAAVPTPGPDQDGMRLGVKYVLGNITLAGLWQSVSDIGNVSGRDRDVIGVGAAFKAGNNVFKIQHYKADERDDLASTGGDQTSIGFDHLFNKAVKGYVTYAQTSNDPNATFGVGGNGHGEVAIPAAGRDASGFSVGMIYDF